MMEFSLLFFSSNEAEFQQDKYQLLYEATAFADQHDFKAVWLPERHFHPFGGLYPNPATLAAALAGTTSQIRLRAGSVVLPLHHPIRVAEEWAVVDNLSGGRVDLSFATGWNPNDFVLAPQAYEDRVALTYQGIEAIQHLWRGGQISFLNGLGQDQEIGIYPQPQQSELSIWLTCSGGEERYIDAAERGYNVLTALLFQSVDELAPKIARYRETWANNPQVTDRGHVTLMLHTYLDQTVETVRQQVRDPLLSYLESSVNLWQQDWQSLDRLTEKERQRLLDYAFERYYQTKTLMGTPESCLDFVSQLSVTGVDEIACLIDFGVEQNVVLQSLKFLNQLKVSVTAS
ncbi:MAG: MupA/Atu3671 family FMN-dependent luciferase-like monooxygenase [Chloroflexota bacterium]